MPPRVPKWLDRAYIESVVREKHSDETLKVVEVNVLPAAGKDQNFASVIFRLQLRYTRGESKITTDTSLIVKTSLENGDNQKLHNALEKFDVFEHEAFIYEEVIPKAANLLRRIKCDEQLAPEMIKFDRVRKCIILEDLCRRGYLMSDKRKGLDLRHIKLILKKVAKYHAAVSRQNEISGGSLQKFDRSVFTCGSNEFEPFFAGQLRVCGQAIQKWEGYETYGEKILKLVPKVMDLGRYAFQPNPDHFNTIIHGDLWVNNAMFRYEDLRPQNVILLDYQFSCWASPAIDLHYLFGTSINFETRVNFEEELVKFYHQHLVDSLDKLEYSGNLPSYESFWQQYIDKSFYAITSTCGILPLVLNEEEIDHGSLMQDEESLVRDKEKIINQRKIQQFLKHLLPIFDIRGYFDKSV